MARLYYVIALAVSVLLLAGGLTSAAVAAAETEAVDAPGGKKVTMSMRYAAADPEKKVRISVQYVDEDAGSDNKFSMDVSGDEPYAASSPSFTPQRISQHRVIHYGFVIYAGMMNDCFLLALIFCRLGIAVQYLLSNLEALRDEAKASRAEL
ncbi:hypothetical protein EJB05_03124 [Eragrostis curvula]|uniref:GOLD domain-containing protein n=1 Tax=Eragrostis curvula TaxID=38414 RepID=A0A5J9WUD7_9POAL|nr:hypothetical protein EJB05_03124 [Eragrostis curvula]